MSGPRVLLDTNVVIRFLNGRAGAIRDQVLSLDDDEAVLCSVVRAELLYGARASAAVDKNLRRIDAFFENYVSLPFDDAAAHQYGLVRAQLRRAGTPIGNGDLMIASIALTHDLAVATGNGREFRRVPGLRVLEW